MGEAAMDALVYGGCVLLGAVLGLGMAWGLYILFWR